MDSVESHRLLHVRFFVNVGEITYLLGFFFHLLENLPLLMPGTRHGPPEYLDVEILRHALWHAFALNMLYSRLFGEHLHFHYLYVFKVRLDFAITFMQSQPLAGKGFIDTKVAINTLLQLLHCEVLNFFEFFEHRL